MNSLLSVDSAAAQPYCCLQGLMAGMLPRCMSIRMADVLIITQAATHAALAQSEGAQRERSTAGQGRTVRHAVGQGHDNHGQEGGDRLLDQIPPDLHDVDDHEGTNQAVKGKRETETVGQRRRRWRWMAAAAADRATSSEQCDVRQLSISHQRGAGGIGRDGGQQGGEEERDEEAEANLWQRVAGRGVRAVRFKPKRPPACFSFLPARRHQQSAGSTPH